MSTNIFKEPLEKAKASVKRQKKLLKEAKGTDDEARCRSNLKRQQTKLDNLEHMIKEFKKMNKKMNKTSFKEKLSNATQAVKNTGKKAFNWTFLTAAGVVTIVGGYMCYDYFKSDGDVEKAPETDHY